MKIVIGSDHAGFKLKGKIKEHLINKGFEISDVGTNSTDSASKVGQFVGSGQYPYGLLICGSGIGMAIAANKIKGVRAAVGYNRDSAKLARNHNNANILTLGARLIDDRTALETVDSFFESDFDGGRHQRRINKISAIEEK